MIWRDFEAAAPELARLGTERLDGAGVALLGTLRRSGAPRISPIETFRAAGHLRFGVITWSGKAQDLARDPRCAVHSATSSPDAGEGELSSTAVAGPRSDRTDARLSLIPARPSR
jgi:hypothetical protein